MYGAVNQRLTPVIAIWPTTPVNTMVETQPSGSGRRRRRLKKSRIGRQNAATGAMLNIDKRTRQNQALTSQPHGASQYVANASATGMTAVRKPAQMWCFVESVLWGNQFIFPRR